MKIKALYFACISILLILAMYVIHDLNITTLTTKQCFLVNNSALIFDQKSLNRFEFFKVKRTDSYPYVSGDTFRMISDYVLDNIENSLPNDFNLKQNAKIFLKTDYLDRFFNQYFPQIKSKIILISHNSDYPVSIRFKQYLEDSRILAWFGQNAEFLHPKLIPIPIGFQNTHISPDYSRKIMQLRNAKLKPWNSRKIVLYINFNFKTNVNARQKFLNFFESFKDVMIIKNRVSFSTYIGHLNDTKFVLCPRGNGLDTHRFYETVLMGAIPIVESSALDPIYENRTVLVLPKLEQLTQDMLDNPHLYIKNMNFSQDLIFMETWLRKLFSYG
ncbi:unnamed protein product [Brachionus calyciflorus]|uniref:RXYLT1 C-terminal domain-containing protein n=1 Tax=Brachionus calyciflorus TaxID=104777 RepID=A0A813SHV0_9BILA|nr:unnamed protein product [Brachionus calyciflorus]